MDIPCHHLRIEGPRAATASVRLRYDMLNLLWRGCRHARVRLLAFGFDHAGIRVALEGARASLAIEGVASAIRLHDVRVHAWVEAAEPVPAVFPAVVWAHRGPVDADPELPGALASPWSSHRDLLGYRVAPFYRRRVLSGRVALDEVHEACGGGPPPVATPRGEGAREDLLLLSRVAGSVLGREPADPKCFSLFAQLAKARGWATTEIAAALLVSSRRVRQLCDMRVRELSLAFTALTYPDTVGRLP